MFRGIEENGSKTFVTLETNRVERKTWAPIIPSLAVTAIHGELHRSLFSEHSFMHYRSFVCKKKKKKKETLCRYETIGF